MLEAASNNWFNAVFEKINAGMVITDTEGSFLRVNPASCRFLGYTQEELLALGLLDVTYPDDRALVQRDFKEVLAGLRQAIDIEKRCVRKDGAIVWARATAVCLRNEQANPTYCVAIMQDITERKQAEETLAQLASIVGSSNDAIVGKTLEGTIVSWNAAAERIYGYSAEEVKGRSISIIVPPDRADELPQIRERIEQGERVEHYETVRVRKDGKQIDVSITISPINDAAGNIVGASAIARDITERKRAEEALRESEAHYRAVAESAPNAFVVADWTGRIITWNKAAQRVFQYTEEEVLGQPLTLIMPERYRRAYQEGMRRYRQTGTPGNIGKATELHGLRKDGSEFPVEVSLSSWKTEQGEFYHGIVRDTTEHKQAEEQLRSSTEQLRALAAHLQSVREEERTRIAREIHDELSPALTALMMDLSWLSGGLTEDQKALLKKTKSMSKLIDGTIQSVRKIASELRPGVLDDLGLATAIDWQAQEFQARTGIRCRISLLPQTVTLDSLRSTAIFRICQELLTNVARHSHASRVNISLEERSGDLTLEVRDNGKGIAETEISSPKSLGLLGMRERALLIGGEFKISSVPGKGTTATVRIPL
jgi:PAS domain S-box-containing protein